MKQTAKKNRNFYGWRSYNINRISSHEACTRLLISSRVEFLEIKSIQSKSWNSTKRFFMAFLSWHAMNTLGSRKEKTLNMLWETIVLSTFFVNIRKAIESKVVPIERSNEKKSLPINFSAWKKIMINENLWKTINLPSLFSRFSAALRIPSFVFLLEILCKLWSLRWWSVRSWLQFNRFSANYWLSLMFTREEWTKFEADLA